MKLILISLELITFVVLYVVIHSIFTKHINRKREKKLKEKLDSIDKEKNTSFEFVNKRLRQNENKESYFSFTRIEGYLKSMGNPLKSSPGEYIVSKFMFSFIFFGIVSMSGNYFFGLLSGILGYFIIDIYYRYKDRKDMETIKLELADVYDLLNIQTSAGVFIGDALTEAYLIVANKRLKNALAELSAEINITNNIEKALDNFSAYFNSVEIDGLAMTIKQSLITGQSKEAIEDMSNSLKETNLITQQEYTSRIGVTQTFIQTLMYIGILSVVLFGMFIELADGWSGFFSN